MWILPKQLLTSVSALDTEELTLDCEEFCQLCEQRQPQREAEGNAGNKDQQGDRHEAQPIMGGATPGTRSGVDATANRVDRLRLLGNGVVPSTCEVAFRTLYNELMNDRDTDRG